MAFVQECLFSHVLFSARFDLHNLSRQREYYREMGIITGSTLPHICAKFDFNPVNLCRVAGQLT